jgi:hypothetical protein
MGLMLQVQIGFNFTASISVRAPQWDMHTFSLLAAAEALIGLLSFALLPVYSLDVSSASTFL